MTRKIHDPKTDLLSDRSFLSFVEPLRRLRSYLGRKIYLLSSDYAALAVALIQRFALQAIIFKETAMVTLEDFRTRNCPSP